MNTPDWSKDDDDIDKEFESVIGMVRSQKDAQPVPSKLDRKIKRLARVSATDEFQQHWIFSNAARLTLGILVFFAIAMLWLTL